MSVHQLCLPNTTFIEDVELAAALGYDGIGIDAGKLADNPAGENLAAFQESGLAAGVCCGSVWSILPTGNFRDPPEPGERVEAICRDIVRLAPYHPESVFCVLGAEGDDPAASLADVEEGLLRIADVAGQHGIAVSVEPMVREGGRLVDGPLVASIADTVELLDRLGIDGGVVADIWHLHDSPHFLEELRHHAGRIAAVQMCDYHQPRVWRDRLMPGNGSGRVREALAALDGGGFTGWLDLEVFSDELWELPAELFMARGLQAMRRCWDERTAA